VQPELAQAVRRRAQFRCEYCLFPQNLARLPFHIDHIVAKKHGGLTRMENLAFACAYCNGFKGTNLSGLDPATGQMTRLFNPRTDPWREHFVWDGPELLGLTPIGRTTIEVLRINHHDAVALRAVLIELGEFTRET